jgi:DNA-binding HxlR family transcriptional regulator
MPYRSFDQNCSIARALEVIGERWTLLVMREVLLSRRRFEEIRRHTGVASNILSDRLDTLVEHGVLERRRYAEKPEAFEYRATEKGLELQPVLTTLMGWGDRHMAPAEGPPRVFVHTTCDHDTTPRLVCDHCGEAVDARTIRVRPGPGANEPQRDQGVLPAARL